MRSLLALKLFRTQRHTHIMSAVFDEGLALFAGLNVIPKRSFLTGYSCRIDPACYPKLMRHWFDAISGLVNPGEFHLFGLIHTAVFFVSSSALGPLLAGLTRDWQGSFAWALLLFVITPLPIAVLSLMVISPREYSHRLTDAGDAGAG